MRYSIITYHLWLGFLMKLHNLIDVINQTCNSVHKMRINKQNNVSWGCVKEDSCSRYIYTNKLMRTNESISSLSA